MEKISPGKKWSNVVLFWPFAVNYFSVYQRESDCFHFDEFDNDVEDTLQLFCNIETKKPLKVRLKIHWMPERPICNGRRVLYRISFMFNILKYVRK